jgi:hypothetical protein
MRTCRWLEAADRAGPHAMAEPFQLSHGAPHERKEVAAEEPVIRGL